MSSPAQPGTQVMTVMKPSPKVNGTTPIGREPSSQRRPGALRRIGVGNGASPRRIVRGSAGRLDVGAMLALMTNLQDVHPPYDPTGAMASGESDRCRRRFLGVIPIRQAVPSSTLVGEEAVCLDGAGAVSRPDCCLGVVGGVGVAAAFQVGVAATRAGLMAQRCFRPRREMPSRPRVEARPNGQPSSLTLRPTSCSERQATCRTSTLQRLGEA